MVVAHLPFDKSATLAIGWNEKSGQRHHAWSRRLALCWKLKGTDHVSWLLGSPDICSSMDDGKVMVTCVCASRLPFSRVVSRVTLVSDEIRYQKWVGENLEETWNDDGPSGTNDGRPLNNRGDEVPLDNVAHRPSVYPLVKIVC